MLASRNQHPSNRKHTCTSLLRDRTRHGWAPSMAAHPETQQTWGRLAARKLPLRNWAGKRKHQSLYCMTRARCSSSLNRRGSALVKAFARENVYHGNEVIDRFNKHGYLRSLQAGPVKFLKQKHVLATQSPCPLQPSGHRETVPPFSDASEKPAAEEITTPNTKA